MEFIAVAILIVLIAYFMGLTVVNVIDQRLSQIKVNIPQSALQPSPAPAQVEGYTNWTPESGAFTGNIEDHLGGYRPKQYSEIERQAYAMDLWNGGRSQACFRDHEHDAYCGVGPMNMSDPRKMTELDREFFRRDYRPTDMTLQDYVNWLYLFRGDTSKLPYEHVKNLTKMLGGEKLQVRVGILPPPQECSPSMNAEDWYNCTLARFPAKEGQSGFIEGFDGVF